MALPSFSVERNPFGQLVATVGGRAHVGVVPVRAFPFGAPDEGLSLIDVDGHEVLWLADWSAIDPAARTLLQAELALREFMPEVLAIRAVSTFSTPSTWTVDTDRGAAAFVLKSEDDIRRLAPGRLLIAAASGVQFVVPDSARLDRHSRRLLERFL